VKKGKQDELQVKKYLKEILFLLISICGAFFISGLIILFSGEHPSEVFSIFIEGIFGSTEGILYTLFFSTPLIFTGLSVAFALKGGLFNIGAEGQLYIGSMAAAFVGFTLVNFPPVVLIPLTILVSIIGGGLWGSIAGFLKAKFGSHEVINTIMLNFIAISLVGYLSSGPFKNPGDQIPQTPLISESARIPEIHTIFPAFPETVPLNISFFIAIFSAIFAYVLLKYTKLGYEIRSVGFNPDASRLSGISLIKINLLTMFISGAFAGMVSINEVLGYRYRFLNNFSPGYGYFGIAVALLGKNHPLGVIASAIFFGAISRGGLLVDIHSDRISRDVIFVIQGIIILFVISRELMSVIAKRKKYTAL